MKLLSDKPHFLFLFPVFFYLLGYTEYGEYIEFKSLLLPFALFFIIVSIFTFAVSVLNKVHKQAAQTSLWVLCIAYSFFGDIKDQLSHIYSLSWLSKYWVLVPSLVFLIGVTYYLLKSRHELRKKIFVYINYLMIVLCVLQLFLCVQSYGSYRPITRPTALKHVQVKNKPDIYFVLFDGYPGQQSLQEYFHFDNSDLVNHLREKKMMVFDTMHSNYNLTINSLNAQLNLAYLDSANLFPWNQFSMYLKSYRSIREARLIQFLQEQGYSINNLSIFDFQQTETKHKFSFLRKGVYAMHQKLFHNQVYKNFFWVFCKGRFKIDWVYNKISLHNHHLNNTIIEELVHQQAKQSPQFTYAHLLLPHEPYFTDSVGKLLPQQQIHDKRTENAAYLEYLTYTNTRMKQLADSLVKQHPESIIILQSDHGWRDYPKAHESFFYNNFMSVYLPEQQYDQVKQVKSNVNLFRVLLNQYFQQELPLLKDSCFFVDEVNNKFETRPYFAQQDSSTTSLLQSKQ